MIDRRTAIYALGAVAVLPVFGGAALAQSGGNTVMIHFDAGRSDIAASAKKLVEVIVSLIKPNAQVSIEGHADKAEANPEKLALARATAVLSQIAALGAPAGVKFTITGKGATIVGGPEAPRNRRVVITIA